MWSSPGLWVSKYSVLVSTCLEGREWKDLHSFPGRPVVNIVSVSDRQSKTIDNTHRTQGPKGNKSPKKDRGGFCLVFGLVCLAWAYRYRPPYLAAACMPTKYLRT